MRVQTKLLGKKCVRSRQGELALAYARSTCISALSWKNPTKGSVKDSQKEKKQRNSTAQSSVQITECTEHLV